MTPADIDREFAHIVAADQTRTRRDHIRRRATLAVQAAGAFGVIFVLGGAIIPGLLLIGMAAAAWRIEGPR